jgi:hypothetical protein
MISSATKLHNLGWIQFFFPNQRVIIIIIVLWWYTTIAKGKNLFLDGDLKDYDICNIKIK